MIDTAVAPGQRLDDEFLAVVSDDDEWLRAEFDAIIAANWPAPESPGRVSDGSLGERRFELSLMVVHLQVDDERTGFVAGDGPSRNRAPPG